MKMATEALLMLSRVLKTWLIMFYCFKRQNPLMAAVILFFKVSTTSFYYQQFQLSVAKLLLIIELLISKKSCYSNL